MSRVLAAHVQSYCYIYHHFQSFVFALPVSSASESEEEASQQKSPVVISPLAQHTTSLQSPKEKSYESNAVVEDESKITPQATVISDHGDSNTENLEETVSNLSKPNEDSMKDASTESEDQLTEKSHDQISQKQKESSVNGLGSLSSDISSESAPVDSGISTTVESTTDTGNDHSSATTDDTLGDATLSTQSTLEFSAGSQDSDAKEDGTSSQEIERAKDEEIPEQERKNKGSETTENQPHAQKSTDDAQPRTELQPNAIDLTKEDRPQTTDDEAAYKKVSFLSVHFKNSTSRLCKNLIKKIVNLKVYCL